MYELMKCMMGYLSNTCASCYLILLILFVVFDIALMLLVG